MWVQNVHSPYIQNVHSEMCKAYGGLGTLAMW